MGGQCREQRTAFGVPQLDRAASAPCGRDEASPAASAVSAPPIRRVRRLRPLSVVHRTFVDRGTAPRRRPTRSGATARQPRFALSECS